jgi:hypothetical protein
MALVVKFQAQPTVYAAHCAACGIEWWLIMGVAWHPLQYKCLCYLAGNSQVTWLLRGIATGACKNDSNTLVTPALIK